MKIYLIFLGLFCLNFLIAQDVEEDYEYEEYVQNRNVIEGGLEYFIPQGDFGRKSNGNSLGGSISYLRQINLSRFFLGFEYSGRMLDSETINDYAPQLDLQAKVSSTNYSLLARFYPQLYFSIFEFFADGGLGLHVSRTITRDYDALNSEYFNINTIHLDRSIFINGGVGFHTFLAESWFLTVKSRTSFGPNFEFYRRADDLTNVEFPEDYFQLTSSAFINTTIGLSLTYIF